MLCISYAFTYCVFVPSLESVALTFYTDDEAVDPLVTIVLV